MFGGGIFSLKKQKNGMGVLIGVAVFFSLAMKVSKTTDVRGESK